MPSNLFHISLYLFTHSLIGSIFSSLGPFLPFLASATNHSESYFTWLITVRGISFIFAGFVKVWIIQKVDLHKGLRNCCFGVGISAIAFTFTYNRILLCFIIFVLNLFFMLADVFCNIVIMRKAQDNVKMMMTLMYIFMCLGSFYGPFLVSFFGISCYSILGAFMILLSLIYSFLHDFPEN